MSDLSPDLRRELQILYDVSASQVQAFQENGHVQLSGVFSAELLAQVGPRIARIVGNHRTRQPDLQKRDTYGKAFLQIGSLWRQDDQIGAFCLAPRLGAIAAALLQVRGIRLYHDQALFKEPGGG